MMIRSAMVAATILVLGGSLLARQGEGTGVYTREQAERGRAALGAERPTFDVASIRINLSGEDRVSGGFMPGGRFAATNYSLRSLVAAAYLRPQINPDFLIAGGPAWIDSTRFDVNARAAQEWPSGPDGPRAPRRVMLQNLLADRFGLRTHTEARPAGLYRLVRSDERTLGPQLQPADLDCGSARPVDQVAVPGAGAPCQISIGPGYVLMKRVRLSQFVNLLPRFVNRVVENDTHLEDAVDLELHWAPAPGEWVAPGARVDDSDWWPSLPAAIQEQLGLRLVPQRGEVDYLVIDDVHMPDAN